MLSCKYITMGITTSYSQSARAIIIEHNLRIATWDYVIIPGLDMFQLNTTSVLRHNYHIDNINMQQNSVIDMDY